MKNLLPLFSLLILTSFFSFGQDTIYYDKTGKETLVKKEAKNFEVLIRDAANPDQVIVKKYHDNGHLSYEFPYSSYEDKIAHGSYRTWFKDGQLRSEKHFKNGKSHGSFITYWENGRKKREDHYKNGKWKEGTTWDELGNEVPYYEFEIRPQFPGGKKALVRYLQKNAKKPNGVAGGKVLVGFVIDVDGSITDVRVEKSSSINLNLTAYNVVVNMPAWKPGQHDGKIVRVKYSIPLTFR